MDKKAVFQHDVYICFSHPDGDAVEILETALRNYVVPGELNFAHRHLRIFLDAPEITRAELTDIFTQPLQHSRKFLVVYSPKTWRDAQINRQIQEFLSVRTAEDIVPVLLNPDGRDESTLLPAALQAAGIHTRPVVITNPQHLAHPHHHPETYSSWLQLLSGLLDIDSKQLGLLEQKQLKRGRRLRTGLFIGGALTIAFLALFWWLQQRAASEAARNNARAEQLLSQSQLAQLDNNPLLQLHLLSAAYDNTSDTDLREKMAEDLHRHWPVAQLQGVLTHDAPLSGVALSPDSTRLLLWGNNTARVWMWANEMPNGDPLVHEESINGAAWLNNGAAIMTWSADGETRITPFGEGKTRSFSHELGVELAIDLSDGSHLVTTADDFIARLWNMNTGALLNTCPHDGWIGGVAASPDGREFITWSDDSTLQRWSAGSGARIGRAMRHSGSLNGAAYHPGGSRILSWTTDGTIDQWQVPENRPFSETIRHQDAVLGARYLRDGAVILSWSADNTARLWDARTGKAIEKPFRHENWVLGAVPDDAHNQLLTWGYDNTARLWQMSPHQQIGNNMRHRSAALGTSSGVYFGDMSPDGRWLISAGSDGALRLWQRSGDPAALAAVLQHAPVESDNRLACGAVFLNKAKTLITWNGDNTVKIWKLIDNPYEKIQQDQHLTAQLQAWTGTRLLTAGGDYSITVVE